MRRLYKQQDLRVSPEQSGQTLVETLVAVFILAMGLTAAAGLANFAFSSSTNIVKQIIAIGLARQGVEAVKNMRDINWLNSVPGGGAAKGTPTSDCYNFLNGQNTATCYKDWLTAVYNLSPGASPASYTLSYNFASTGLNPNFWSLSQAGATPAYGLNLNALTPQLYSPNLAGPQGTSDFYRKITLTADASPTLFDKTGTLGPRLQVRVQVWWKDKKCPASADYPASGGCRITLQTYLTNWKTN